MPERCLCCSRPATWWTFSAAGPVIRSCSHHRARLRAKMAPHSEMFPIAKVIMTEAGFRDKLTRDVTWWSKIAGFFRKQGSQAPQDAR